MKFGGSINLKYIVMNLKINVPVISYLLSFLGRCLQKDKLIYSQLVHGFQKVKSWRRRFVTSLKFTESRIKNLNTIEINWIMHFLV